MELKKGIPFSMKDSKQLIFDNITIMNPDLESPLYFLTNTQEVKISNCTQFSPANLYLKGDEACEKVYLINNLLPQTKQLTNLNKDKLYSINNIQ